MQKYQHIIESYACILKIFLLPIISVISLGIFSTLKLSKRVTLSLFPYKTIQWVFLDLYLSSRLITYVSSYILGNLFLK